MVLRLAADLRVALDLRDAARMRDETRGAVRVRDFVERVDMRDFVLRPAAALVRRVVVFAFFPPMARVLSRRPLAPTRDLPSRSC